MHPFKELRYDIAASLWAVPTTFEKLRERDFLKNISEYGVSLAVRHLENDDMIYEDKEGILHTSKKALPALNKEGYELT